MFFSVYAHIIEFAIDQIYLIFCEAKGTAVNKPLDHPKLINDLRLSLDSTFSILNL